MDELDLAMGYDMAPDVSGGGSGGGFLSGAGDFFGGLLGGVTNLAGGIAGAAGALAPAAAQFYTGLQANKAAAQKSQAELALAMAQAKRQAQNPLTNGQAMGWLPWIIGGGVALLLVVLLVRK